MMWVDLADDLEPRSVVLPRRRVPGMSEPAAAAAAAATAPPPSTGVIEFVAAGGEWVDTRPPPPASSNPTAAAPAAAKPWGALRPGPTKPPCSICDAAEDPLEYTPCLGIDLGSTNTVVAAWNGRTAVVLRSFQYSSTVFPSVVAYKENGTVLAGAPALKQWQNNPQRTIHNTKAWLGRAWDDVAKDRDRHAYPIEYDPDRDLVGVPIKGKDKLVTPVELAAVIIEQVKRMAMADHIRRDVREAVVTVPVGFTNAQREATKRACELAGLTTLMVLTEPVAAMLACGLHTTKTEENLWQRKNTLVFDLGGSTLDVSVLHTNQKRTEVLAHATDERLGGDDFDALLYEHMRTEIPKKNKAMPVGPDGKLKVNPQERIRLLQKSCEVKEALSGVPNQSYQVEIANQTYVGSLTRAKLNLVCEPLVGKAMALLEATLKESGLHKGSIDDVVLVGGASKFKRVQDVIEKFFLGFKAFIVRTEHPDHLIAEGACVQAAAMVGNDAPGGIPSPRVPLTANVVPQAVGVAVDGDGYSIVIPRNAPVPASLLLEKHHVYHTTRDNQTTLTLALYQGEATKAADNFLLGCCTLEGIPPRPAGAVDVCARYTFDMEGSLEVEAWVQGEGHTSARLVVTEDAYERHLLHTDGSGYPRNGTAPPGHGAAAATGEQLFMDPRAVPMDDDDLRRAQARERELQRQRDQRKKERKAARERKNRAKELEEQDRIIRHRERRESLRGSEAFGIHPTQGSAGSASARSQAHAAGRWTSRSPAQQSVRPTKSPPPSTPLKRALSKSSLSSFRLDPNSPTTPY